MFTIGDFASLGRVSVRMLRHYDAIGLLRPATVDPHSGYRYYRADQLRRLNRIVALKDLGFTLDQVGSILADTLTAEELRGMLRLRQAQLQARLLADTARLSGVEGRLRMISEEGHMTTEEVVLKPIPAVRIAEVSGIAASYETADITPVIQPLYTELSQRLIAAGLRPGLPGLAWYEPAATSESPEAVRVHAGQVVDVDPDPAYPFQVVDLPAFDLAATIMHDGSMEHADRSMQILARWIEEHDYRIVGKGYARELYLDYDPEQPEHGVTELQIAVVKP